MEEATNIIGKKQNNSADITTIKISRTTKERLEKIRSHRRETYEDIIKRVIDVLNLCKINPEKARTKLRFLDKMHKKIKLI